MKTRKFSKVYVVALNDRQLWTSSIYDRETAECVCSTAHDMGLTDAKVMTLASAIKNGYYY